MELPIASSGGVSENAFRACVPTRNDAVQILPENGVARAFDNGRQAAGSHLPFFPAGDVRCNSANSHWYAIRSVQRKLDRQIRVDAAGLAAHAPPSPVGAPSRNNLAIVLRKAIRRLAPKNSIVGTAQHVRLPQAEEFLKVAVHQEVAPLEILQRNHRRRVIQNCLQALVGFGVRKFRPRPFGRYGNVAGYGLSNGNLIRAALVRLG